MITMTLTDSTGSVEIQAPEVPLSQDTIEGTVDVVTLDNNVSTYMTSNKSLWSHTWAYMTSSDYDVVRGFYDRQFTLFKYPLLTISDGSATNVVVRMSMGAKNIIDDCGTVGGASVTWRETRQMP